MAGKFIESNSVTCKSMLPDEACVPMEKKQGIPLTMNSKPMKIL